MYILVTYDVNTETKAGRRRLRQVAVICKDFGQRVQFSVFECQVEPARYEEMKHRLTKTMNPDEDSLRIYRLPGQREQHIETYGVDRYVSFEEPLIF
ncbi:CRISPR-associated endonuclease Cas2 [Rubrobacter indicoceani]|uniref:CRISPR-associated endonuclease Cas2 n=1 Tax=Rubrobacter indicoceani TaxID=2051957 RepID=UPI000E5A3BF0|nr:CRISPR-associated endonuclease Cas2 [Rubrobacter indicoceani]